MIIANGESTQASPSDGSALIVVRSGKKGTIRALSLAEPGRLFH